MEILALLIIVYALKHAITDTKGAAKRSREAYLKSADKRFPDMPKGKRAAHAARHDLGWGLSQAGHGLPATRHGFMTGWHQSREAHHRAMLGRQAAKTAHLETRAGAVGQLKEYRARQQAALEEYRSGKASGKASGKRGWLVTGMPEPKERTSPEPVEEGTPEGTSPETSFPVVLMATSKSGKPLDPITGSPTATATVWGQEDLDRRLAAAADDPDIEVSTRPVPSGEDAGPGGTTVTEDHWDDPLPGEEGSSAPEEGTSSDDDETATSDIPRYEIASDHSRYRSGYDDEQQAHDSARTASNASPGHRYEVFQNSEDGTPAHVATYRNGERTDPSTSPTSTASTEGTRMADTSYSQIHADMDRDNQHAEQAAAEQRQVAAQQENAHNEAQAAMTRTNATVDAASEVEVDAATQSALMEHADAQRLAAEAHAHAHEATQSAEGANVRVQETAEQVKAALSRHAVLAQAHQDSPVEAADKEFYQEA